MQPALPPHRSLGRKGLWKCINARERGRLTDSEEEEEEERGRANKRGRETARCYWLTVRTSSVIEIFLSQSKKQRKAETVDSGNTIRSVFKTSGRDKKDFRKKEGQIGRG